MVEGKKLCSRVMLSLIVGTIVGHTGRVLVTRSYPSEKWVYMKEMFETVLFRMKQQNIDPPAVVWVDDWKKWHALLMALLENLWPGIGSELSARRCVIGQDWAHFQHPVISL